MRFILHLLIITELVYLVTCTTTASNNNVPIVIYSRIDLPDADDLVPLGSSISSNQFREFLEKIFHAPTKNKKIAVVIAQLPFTWSDVHEKLPACQVIDQHGMFYQFPSVHNGYTELIDHLNDKDARRDIKQTKDLKEALEMFCKLRKNPNYDGVVLTRLDDNKEEEATVVSSEHSRHARSVYSLNSNITDTYLFGDQCAALYNSIFIKNSTVTTDKPVITPLTLDAVNSAFSCCTNCATNNTAQLSFKFQAGTGAEYVTEATLIFARGNRDWKLVNSSIKTTVRELALTYMELPYSFETPFHYSLACTTARFKLSDPVNQKAFKQRIELYISGLQFQPFDVKVVNGSSYTFGRVNYCSGFFTNGIWMGIASSLIMAAILSMGVYLMLTVNTMDRFDDPKGKALTINAEK